MTGTTYGRTSGTAISPRTYREASKRLPDGVRRLPPYMRTDWDACLDEVLRELFRRAHARENPPEFLEFRLAEDTPAFDGYPGAIPAVATTPGTLIALQSVRQAMELLGISDLDLLQAKLNTFTGEVQVVPLMPGTPVYRSVGLLVGKPQDVAAGRVTNKLLGDFWDPRCPSSYRDIAHWRADTAVHAEWNGDMGYVVAEVRPGATVYALYGTVGAQPVPGDRSMCLPGGGKQLWIPHLRDEDLVEPISGRPLIEVIRETRFGTEAPPA